MSQDKGFFIRDYSLKISVLNVEYEDTKIVSETELESFQINGETDCNIQFSGSRQLGGFMGSLNLSVYNLSRDKRNLLVKDRADKNKQIRIELYAGYKGSILSIFKGTIVSGTIESRSYDVVNVLESKDGYLEATQDFVSQSFKSGDKIIERIAKKTPFNIGRIDNDITLSRPKVVHGSGVEKIRSFSDEDNLCTVSDELLYFHRPQSPLITQVAVVNASTGLMGVPNKNVDRIEIDMKINPSVKAGAVIKLESVKNPAANGYYVVEKITYNGDYNGDSWNQSVSAYEYKGGIVRDKAVN